MIRILIVDDADNVRAVLRDALEARGYEVLEAREGYEGYCLARASAPSLVIMDLLMPGVDGCRAVDLLKGDPVTKNVPVVAFTGLRLETDLADAGSHPFDGFVTKPFRVRDIRRLVERILSAHDIPRPDPVPAPVPGGG